nr:hypothetical protein [Aeromonas veronii]
MDVAGGGRNGDSPKIPPCVRPEDVLAHWVKLGIPQKYPPHVRPEDALAHWVKMPLGGKNTHPASPCPKILNQENRAPSRSPCPEMRNPQNRTPSRLPPDFPDLRTYEDAPKRVTQGPARGETCGLPFSTS